MHRTTRLMFALLVAGLIVIAARGASGDTFKVDPIHSFVVFQVKHLDLSYAWGRFVGPTGTFTIDDANPANSSIHVEVRAESINTDHDGRDKHLRGPDFFDARQFPTISFKSTSMVKTGEGMYEITGNLTLHGVTKPLTVLLTKLGEGDRGGPFGYRAGYEATFTIKRSDFGMTNLMNAVGDEVRLFISLEGTR